MLLHSRLFVLLICVFVSLSACHTGRKAATTRTKNKDKLREISVRKDLKAEVKRWLGTPYRYGGNDKKGVDCSGFVHAVYLNVYDTNLPRTSREMYKRSEKISIKKLREGDLLFFDYEGKGVSHVGIYLSGNLYAHASSTRGVVLSDIDNEYSRKHFVGAGRIHK